MAAQNGKAPQDHKKSNVEIYEDLEKEFSEVEGSDLIVPLGKIKGTDQMRIIGKIQSLNIGEDSKESDMDLDTFADVIDWLSEKFSVDPAKFDEWSSGSGGMLRTMKLAMALMQELGKGLSSDAS